MLRKFIVLILVLTLLSGCTTQPAKDPYAAEAFEAEQIRSILVVPALNRSVDVDAPWVLLSTLPEVLGESGYYVFPVNTVKVVLEHEGLYEAALVRQLSPSELANMFEADSVLYITIENWESRYVILTTTTEVTLSYRLVSRSGREMWSAKNTVIKSSDENEGQSNALGNLISSAISAAVQRAVPKYRPLAIQSSKEVFDSPSSDWPDGPYRLAHEEKNKK